MPRTPTRTTRLLVLAAAWAVPLAWALVALLAGPSDGTSLSSRLLPSADPRWGDAVRIAATYGDTPLRVGDEVQRIEGALSASGWTAGKASRATAVSHPGWWRP